MSAPISYCTQRSGTLEAAAYVVTNAITRDTTPDNFDYLFYIHSSHGYRLNYGGHSGLNALGSAAHKGCSPALIRHIVRLGGNTLINLGNTYGWTPLFYAANCANPEKGYLAAKELLRLGADHSLATSAGSTNSQGGDITPEGSTPLWAALEKTHNFALVKLLLQCNATLRPEESLTEEGTKLLRDVQTEITQDKIEADAGRVTFLRIYSRVRNANPQSHLYNLAPDTIRDIYERAKRKFTLDE